MSAAEGGPMDVDLGGRTAIVTGGDRKSVV